MPETGGWTAVSSWESLWNTAGLVIGAEAQVGLVKVNQQLRQVIDTEEFHNYLPRNFASFFTVGYKFR